MRRRYLGPALLVVAAVASVATSEAPPGWTAIASQNNISFALTNESPRAVFAVSLSASVDDQSVPYVTARSELVAGVDLYNGGPDAANLSLRVVARNDEVGDEAEVTLAAGGRSDSASVSLDWLDKPCQLPGCSRVVTVEIEVLDPTIDTQLSGSLAIDAMLAGDEPEAAHGSTSMTMSVTRVE
jgi:hypothetical protein